MQNHLIMLTKYLLCIVSMLLTALFALNFTNQLESTSQVNSDEIKLFSVSLMIAIGIGIDLSKYLFWQFHSGRLSYTLLSLLLVFFSWTASVSYFVTQETSSLETQRLLTGAYQTHQTKISALKQAIEHKESLLNKRLASQYHDQWDKGEQLVVSIQALNEELQILMASSTGIGINEAISSVSTTAFFSKLSQLLHFSLTTITITAYGFLAILIELCALGAISLSQQNENAISDSNATQSAKSQNTVKKPSTRVINQQPNKKIDTADSNHTHYTQKKEDSKNTRKQHLIDDIRTGLIAPVYADIKKGKYGLSQSMIKRVLYELEREGILIKRKRSYRLSNKTN